MSGLFAYWKEISIILSGVFAILGLLWDTKDKATGKITYWGRAFLGLTIASVVGGFVAQALEDSAEKARSRTAQEDMLQLLKRTEQTVSDTNRLLQPLDRPSIFLMLDVDCQSAGFQRFCADMKAKGERREKEINPPVRAHLTVNDLADWSLFPVKGERGRLIVVADFFRFKAGVAEFLNARDCATCFASGDLEIEIVGKTPDLTNEDTLKVYFETDTHDLSLAIQIAASRPYLKNKLLLSLPDLALSTLILSDLLNGFKGLRPRSLSLTTERGQSLDFKEFDAQISLNGKQVFIASLAR